MHLACSSSNILSRFLPRVVLAMLGLCLALAVWAQQGPPQSAPTTDQKAAATTSASQKPAPPAIPEAQQKLAGDAARLLKLATELKAEVDKTSKDTLSLKVVRQAESIEKLAKGVKQELKQSAGPI